MSLTLFTPSLLTPSLFNRRSALSAGIALAERVGEVDAAAWDRLTANSGFFMSRPYLRTVEATRPENLANRYALVYRGREEVAAVAAQRLTVEPRRVKDLLSRSPAVLRARLLVCGNVFSWGAHGVAFAPHRRPEELWPWVVWALERLDRCETRSADVVAVKDFAAESDLPAGGRVSATEPDMVLTFAPGWTCHGDYLAALKPRYRRATARLARQLAAAGCRIEAVDDLGCVAEQIHALYREVHDGARIRLATARPSYLPALAEVCGEALRCSVIRRDDEIVGFVTTIRDGETAVGYHLGFDRGLDRVVPLYPNLLQACVADALALGCRRLSLGRTALESKARLGARPRPLYVWWKGRGLLARSVARFIDTAPCQPPERHPFKTPSGLQQSAK